MNHKHRYELKFTVSADVKRALLGLAGEGLLPDSHGHEGLYRVSSQYFDTPDLKAYWEKLDGVGYRQKFRLRFYGDEPKADAIFFEIKHRWDQTVYKERVPLQLEALSSLLEQPNQILQLAELVETLTSAEERTLKKIVSVAAKTGLTGVNMISYLREAWVGKYDESLRVTFDHLCAAFSPGDASAPLGDQGTPILDPSSMLLEVKFNDRLPVWLRDCLGQVAVQPIRFSKYAEGLRARWDLDLRRKVNRGSGLLVSGFRSFPREKT